jgi:hypothetical protein
MVMFTQGNDDQGNKKDYITQIVQTSGKLNSVSKSPAIISENVHDHHLQ